MFIRDLSKCKEFVAGDSSILRELFNPLKDDLQLRYSLAHATIKPGEITRTHTMKTSEVYYILQGEGAISIDNQTQDVRKGQAVYIPPGSPQRIRNTGAQDLVFICIVDPAWRPEDEEIIHE